ncbi:muconolactone delta-isomerase [Kibdelosporangium banguiense]|uniref:Muconolactone delta-isomerase n=1 Tax=Kibdelosporangium banguiense TaxID=1365924 RepID=A0ABS4TY01_9PSEU|nr:muconolactone Delta-isomerase family protein [Kibdelosporangium banguiense]MBP2329264.1 muconolactone delta-isomerase [Kibdelosporangium banguiense]
MRALTSTSSTVGAEAGGQFAARADTEFDVADNEELHRVLWDLPLFPYLTITVTPLATHPSALGAACRP